jgi:hypothetical protein
MKTNIPQKEKHQCKLAFLNNPPIYELGFWEMANMSINNPLLVKNEEGQWKAVIHYKNGIFI